MVFHWIGIALVCAGCLARPQTDLLEARLRAREREIDDVRRELANAKSELAQQTHRSKSLIAERSGIKANTVSHSKESVSEIQFDPWLTGITEGTDRAPELSLLICPRDSEGTLVKAPGQITISAIDPSAPESKQRLGKWSLSSEEVRGTWYRGLLGTGYQIRLPWTVEANGPEIVIQVRYRLENQSDLSATQILKISAKYAGMHNRDETSRTPHVATRREMVPTPDDIPEDWESPQESRDLTAPVIRPTTHEGFIPNVSNTSKARQLLEEHRSSDRWNDETIPVWR